MLRVYLFLEEIVMFDRILLSVVFFSFTVIIPYSIAHFLFPTAGFFGTVLLFSITVGVVAWMFRIRTCDNIVLVSPCSFKTFPVMALGAGLSTLAGVVHPVLSAFLLLIAVFIVGGAIKKGPVYGWGSV